MTPAEMAIFARRRTVSGIDLDIRTILATEDGHRITLSADGVGVPRAAEPITDRENVSVTTAVENYAWVNARQVWGGGSVNLATRKGHIDTYMQ